jgi:hypothetical protein
VTAEGADPATETLTVTGGRTAKQLAAALVRRRRPRRAARPAAAAAARANAPVSVPDEAGERLDVAEDDMHSKGLSYREIGSGAVGIIVKRKWTICQTKPAAGAQVKSTRARS